MSQDVTIVQIAKESGVSIATVSRVLNGTVPVSPQTRARVEAIIAKYHYTPNTLAQGLIRRQTKTIGVIVPDITNPYFSTLFKEIEASAHQMGYSVLLCNTAYSAEKQTAESPLDHEAPYFQMMLTKKVDGVIIAGGQIDVCKMSNSYLEALRSLSDAIPAVVIGKAIADLPCSFVDKENDLGIQLAIQHLAEQGHRRIAFLGGEPGVHITESRLTAYRQTLQHLNLEFDPKLIALSNYYIEDGYQAACALLAQQHDTTAALAMNDNVALGALRAFQDHDLAVPGDIALVSCDQFYNGDFLTPRLTSVDRHNDRLGQYVTSLLLSKIQQSTEPEMPDLAPELRIRESSSKTIG